MADTPTVVVAGAQRLRGRARRAAARPPPGLRAGGDHVALATPGGASTSCTRTTACRWSWTRSTSSTTATSTPRSSPTRTAPARPRWPSCTTAASRSSTCRADFRLRDPEVYARVVRRARRAEPVRPRGLRPARALPRADRAAPTSSPCPGCYPTAAILGARAARARRAHRRRRHRREVGRLGRRPRRDAGHALRHRRREHEAVQGRQAPPRAGDRPGAAAARRRRDDARSRRTCSRSTRASSSRATSRRRARSTQDELDELYASAYARRAVRRGRRRRARRARRARDEHLPHPRRRRAAHRQAARVQRHRQPLEGHREPGGAEPQPHVRPRRDGGRCGDRVRVALGRAARARRRRRGRRHAARRASAPPASPPGSSPQGLDLGLLVSDAADDDERREVHALGRARRAGAGHARSARDLGAIRAVVANSGNANAATGRPGLDEAARMQGAASMAARRADRARRGVLDRRHRRPARRPGRHQGPARGAARAARRRRAGLRRRDQDHRRARQAASRSTSTLPGGTVRLTAQAKGAGMIQPDFATMLCFVQTDAALSAETCDLLLGVCVKRSFDRISVDGQLSTNDTAILMASGASGVDRRARERGRAALRRGARLRAAPARDPHGPRRRGRAPRRRASSSAAACAEGVERVAREVANSPLVKTAIYGGDPNWGRIAQAIGAALPGTHPLAYDIRVEGTLVCSGGFATPRGRPSSPATRSRSRSRCPATAPRPRSSSPTSATSTSPSTPTTRPE